MMLVDTNVVSEFMRDQPDVAVVRWAAGFDTSEIAVSVITVEEVERGLGRMPPGRRRAGLEQRWRYLIDVYGDVITPYDVAAAHAAVRVLVDGEAGGRIVDRPDAQIAGICLAHGHTLATRNVDDFADIAGLDVIDPFESTGA